MTHHLGLDDRVLGWVIGHPQGLAIAAVPLACSRLLHGFVSLLDALLESSKGSELLLPSGPRDQQRMLLPRFQRCGDQKDSGMGPYTKTWI